MNIELGMKIYKKSKIGKDGKGLEEGSDRWFEKKWNRERSVIEIDH